MVSNASALGRTGIQDWLLIRGSAIVIALYVLYIVGLLLLMTLPMTSGVAFRLFCDESIHYPHVVLDSCPCVDWHVAGAD